MDYNLKNLRQTQSKPKKFKNNFARLKEEGRYGDSEMRKVDGLLSHVSPEEAMIIDKWGKRGEEYVKAIGSGTINPKTGLPEYWNIYEDLIKPAVSSGIEGISDGLSDIGDWVMGGVDDALDYTGRIWDSWIGRNGITGWIGDTLGWWESGQTADKRRAGERGLQNQRDSSLERFNRSIESIDDETENKVWGQNQLMASNISKVGQTNMATDMTRQNRIDNIIASNIRDQNTVIQSGIQDKIGREDLYETEQAKFDNQSKILNS